MAALFFEDATFYELSMEVHLVLTTLFQSERLYADLATVQSEADVVTVLTPCRIYKPTTAWP